MDAYGLSVERASLGERLSLFIWPDYLDPELVAEFERTYGVDVVIDYYDTNEAMIAKLQAGGTGQYDVVVASDYAVEVLTTQGLAEPLDKTNVPNLANLDPRFASPPYDPANTYSVAYQWGTSGIGVRNDLVADPARIVPSWALVFDPARQLDQCRRRVALEIAQLADAFGLRVERRLGSGRPLDDLAEHRLAGRVVLGLVVVEPLADGERARELVGCRGDRGP